MLLNYRPVAAWLLAICCLCGFASSSRAQIDPSQIKIKKKPAPSGGPVAVTFERMNLGPGVNSSYSELFPVITPDEMLLFFVRKGDPTNAGAAKNPMDEDIWYSTRQPDGSWVAAARLDGPLNTANYDGVRAVNSTGTRLYLQNIYREDGTGAKGFSVSERQSDGTWSFPEPLEIEDYYNDTSVAMMSVSNDEQVLILSLKRKDGKGKHDLYLSRHLSGRR